MCKLFILSCLFLTTISQALPQGQYNNWHFGINSGLNFSSGNPVVIPSQVIGIETCASISNAAGDLLFYTNGETVWNADNVAMPNGTGLLSSYDVQQGTLIVPKPGSPNIYYVFSIGYSLVTPDGITIDLTYSIVDMSLNNGLGDVTTKNIVLDQDVTERLTATKHQNGTDFWIIDKNLATNQFKTFLLSASGLGSPVISSGGVPIQDDDFTGAVKVSNGGCWLVSSTRGAFGNPGLIELFHFNNQTGSISGGDVTTLLQHPYGFEFSPDGTKFYVGENDFKPVYQFDLNAGSVSQILASAFAVTANLETYTFQAAPNGKIYFTRAISGQSEFERSLAAIENPNNTGAACNVNLTAFTSFSLYNTGCLPNNFDLTYTGPLNACAIAPVTLLYFKANEIKNDAFLTWATASESNSKQFEVEVSSDGIHYTAIGTVRAAGYSNTMRTYKFTDAGISKYNSALIYYRFKQVDQDGKFSYSNIARLKFADEIQDNNISAYPNPFDRFFSIEITNELTTDKMEQLELYDIRGKLVYSRKVNMQGNYTISVTDLPELSKGMYILKTIFTKRTFATRLLKK